MTLQIRWAAVPVAIAAGALLAGCSSGTDANANAEPSPSPSADAQFTITSTDFMDGGALPLWSKANAFGGQCTGDNISPSLEWSNAPEGTESFAILMVDRDASDFLHWSHADIPASVTAVATGDAETLAGVAGNLAVADGSYFGPCPPDPDHHYAFTVYALDTTLGLAADYSVRDLREALDTHTLAEATIVGISGP